MSCGLIFERLPSIPSISTNGLPLDVEPIVAVPRILIEGVAFNSAPLFEVVILSPGSNPCKACTAFPTGRASKDLDSITPTAPVRFTFF